MRRVLGFWLTSVDRTALALRSCQQTIVGTAGLLTESGQIVFKMVSEVIAFSCGTVVELDVDDMVGILVSDFYDTNHVVGWRKC